MAVPKNTERYRGIYQGGVSGVSLIPSSYNAMAHGGLLKEEHCAYIVVM